MKRLKIVSGTANTKDTKVYLIDERGQMTMLDNITKIDIIIDASDRSSKAKIEFVNIDIDLITELEEGK